jgi:hypothetical protein
VKLTPLEGEIKNKLQLSGEVTLTPNMATTRVTVDKEIK